MKTIAVMAVVAGMLVATLSFSASAAFDPYAHFEFRLNLIEQICTQALQNAGTTTAMDAIAAQCEASVFGLLAWLEAQVGHTIEFESFYICVYNEQLDYTACFDPIIIDGGS